MHMDIHMHVVEAAGAERGQHTRNATGCALRTACMCTWCSACAEMMMRACVPLTLPCDVPGLMHSNSMGMPMRTRERKPLVSGYTDNEGMMHQMARPWAPQPSYRRLQTVRPNGLYAQGFGHGSTVAGHSTAPGPTGRRVSRVSLDTPTYTSSKRLCRAAFAITTVTAVHSTVLVL